MGQVVQNASSEFWQAPVTTPTEESATESRLPEVCPGCAAEFVVGAGFCHVCGTSRTPAKAANSAVAARWLELGRYLQFHQIKEWVGLPTSALVLFLIGMGCALAALLTGFVFTTSSLSDWQAVQVWRIEWLLGSAAAFLAGILLKRK